MIIGLVNDLCSLYKNSMKRYIMVSRIFIFSFLTCNFVNCGGSKRMEKQEEIEEQEGFPYEEVAEILYNDFQEDIEDIKWDEDLGIYFIYTTAGTIYTFINNGSGMYTLYDSEGNIYNTYDYGGGMSTTYGPDGEISTMYY